MYSHGTLSKQDWNRLLNWLAPEAEAAGRKYEDIRRRLITFFSGRGAQDAEALADETMDRTARLVAAPDFSYSGDPTPYFYAVAKNIFLESLRRERRAAPVVEIRLAEQDERRFLCLERCLEKLPAGNRTLVIEYYSQEKSDKIDYRRTLAEKLGLGLNALRIHMFRIRERLRQCVGNCVRQAEQA